MAADPALPHDPLQQGLLSGDRGALARAITRAESTRPSDRAQHDTLLRTIMDRTGKSVRIGITGVPGVGKSTFIETFGGYLTGLGKKVAVLTVDPTSRKTGGSILGDKTRMEQLSRNPNVFIRPSPSGQALGGVTANTRETIFLCEAAGFDVILIETVGVGQSETEVRGMVDFFLLLMLAGAGDELQGIKKGIMEMADGIAVTKADGQNLGNARQAQADAAQALHMLPAPESGSKVPVLAISALENRGIDEVWKMITGFVRDTEANGFFHRQRMQQRGNWFEERMEGALRQLLTAETIQKYRATLMAAAQNGTAWPPEAAATFWRKLIPSAGDSLS